MTDGDRFQSTPPARGATARRRRSGVRIRSGFNPRPPRGGRHAEPTSSCAITGGFNPRPPRGGRPARAWRSVAGRTFQSTPPARGATDLVRPDVYRDSGFNPRPPRGGRPRPARVLRHPAAGFNPRPPRGGRRSGFIQDPTLPEVSIHAPRAGGDQSRRRAARRLRRFQSTPPARGATHDRGVHRPRARGFNPRPPRGGRLTASSR